MRVKGGTVTRRRHKKILKLAEGFRGRRKNCFRLGKLAVQKSLQFAYKGRRLKKRDFRSLWILRINAAARLNGLSYSKLISALKAANIEIDRRVLASLAYSEPEAFKAVVDSAKAA